jgi:hypothetical protein
MFYARYVVLQVGKKEVPFLISDADVHGWEHPRGHTKPYRQKVLGAGFVTWQAADPGSVVCFGSGKMSLDAVRGTTRMVDSRGVVDAALIHALLAQPLNYVILCLDGNDLPIFAPQASDHEDMVLEYQVRPSRCAVSAGVVDFGHADKRHLHCYGEGVFTGRPNFSRPSRGAEDEVFLSAHLVKHMENPGPARAYRLF